MRDMTDEKALEAAHTLGAIQKHFWRNNSEELADDEAGRPA